MVSKAAIIFSDNVSDELHNVSPVGEEEIPPMYLNIIVQPQNRKRLSKIVQVREKCLFLWKTLDMVLQID